MWQTLIAVLGTLAAVAITSGYQARAARTARQETRRAEGLAAVEALVAALADHRRAMWFREDLRLRGEDWSAARTESHATRSAITGPLLRVQLLLPAAAGAAQDAAAAVYALRNADGHPTLNAARTDALTASDDLVAAVGRHLAA
ncbi:protein kilB [Streptomyces albus]|uniref:Protein kilB n=1 Tax=Streptomyces albus TaxID=1888 RepID=A0A8H1LC98_9ACTN|nr:MULTISPECIES: protein kilB [Streptomyces]TGG79174.1 protein kilB [Streptomyces albus]TXJ78662.1 protein kilB [Streptomyces lavendulae]